MRLPDIPLLRAGLVFAAIVGALALLSLLLRPLLLPILLSLILYATLSPAVGHLVRYGLGRSWAIVTVLIGLIGLMIGAVVVAVPLLGDQLVQLQQRLPAVWAGIQARIELAEQWLGAHMPWEVETAALTAPLLDRLQSGGMEMVQGITGVLANVAAIVLLVPLLTFFLLRDFRAIRNRAMNLLPNRGFELGWLIYRRVVERLGNYVVGVMFQSAIMGLVAAVGFAIIGLDLWILLGLLTGLLNIIPYVGPLLAMVLPALLILAADAPNVGWLLLQAIGVVLIAQLIDNLIVVPTLIAQVADLHPLSVLGGIVVMGYLFGFMGMILAIPILFSGKIIFLGLLRGLESERQTAGSG